MAPRLELSLGTLVSPMSASAATSTSARSTVDTTPGRGRVPPVFTLVSTTDARALMARSSAITRAAALAPKEEWSNLTPWRRARVLSPSGSSSRRGGDAPSTKTGITLIRRRSAALISSVTKSSGSSRRRRPSSSTASAQCGPINANNTSHAPTAFSIDSAKSTPGSIESTSIKHYPHRNTSGADRTTYLQRAGCRHGGS